MDKRILTDWRPHASQEVRYKEAGGVLEVTACSRHNHENAIRNLDKDHYVYLPTGEVLERNHADSRADNIKTVRASLARLRDYINTNVTDVRNVRWCTLTYRENMTDTKRLYKDFVNFNKRFKYWLEKQSYPKYEYIAAMEPQMRGAWHVHLLMIFPSEAPYIPNATLAKIWGFGFVKITSLDNCDNVGAYLTAYLADMNLESNRENPEAADDNESHYSNGVKTVKGKRYIKGLRLVLYPVGFQLYRISKGIRPPTVERITESEAMEKVGAATPTFERTIELFDPEKGFSIVINKRYYNRNRKKGQVACDDAPKRDRRIPHRPAGAWQ